MTQLTRRVLAGLVLAVLSAVAKYTLDVHSAATVDQAQKADVIVVFGAAEYSGRPSPVLRARLDHALSLYKRGLAPRILTTGGAGGDPVFTEGEVGRAYLVKRNVPSEAIIVEPEASSTAESAAAIREILLRMNLRTCIVVSDGYHLFRVRRILESHGVKAFGSPRPGESVTSARYWWLCARQAGAYMLWSAGLVV